MISPAFVEMSGYTTWSALVCHWQALSFLSTDQVERKTL